MNDEQNGNKPHAITEDSIFEYLSVEVNEDLKLAAQIIGDLRYRETIDIVEFSTEIKRAMVYLHTATGKKLLQEK